MSFNDSAQLDPSQVEDRRGSGMGRGTKIGGGIGGGIVVLLLALFGINPNMLGDLTGSGTQPTRRRKWRRRRCPGMPDRC